MDEMSKEMIIEKIQEAEMIAWNNYRRAEETYGGGSTMACVMKNRHEATRDLMKDLDILCIDKVERKLAH